MRMAGFCGSESRQDWRSGCPLYADWRFVSKGAGSHVTGTGASGFAVAGRGNQQVLLEMRCESAKHQVGITLRVHGRGQPFMESVDGPAYGSHHLLGGVEGC